MNKNKNSKCFGVSKRSHDLNFLRESRVQPQAPNVKVIKAPKFANKVYEKSMKVNNKSGRNESNMDNNF